jgi:hypothetical protein
MRGELVMIGLVVLVLVMVGCVLVGGTVDQGLQHNASMLQDAQQYLTDCKIGTVRHLKGSDDNHSWSEIWACERDGHVQTATLICMDECSKTLVITVYPDWGKIDAGIKSGEYSEIK